MLTDYENELADYEGGHFIHHIMTMEVRHTLVLAPIYM